MSPYRKFVNWRNRGIQEGGKSSTFYLATPKGTLPQGSCPEIPFVSVGDRDTWPDEISHPVWDPDSKSVSDESGISSCDSAMRLYSNEGRPPSPFTGYPKNLETCRQPRSQIDPVVQKWFDAVNKDTSGEISTDKLQCLMVGKNWGRFSGEACRMMIELHDKDGSGTIDISEFQQLLESINQWSRIFHGFDKEDLQGGLNQSEMTKAFQEMGYTFSPWVIQRMLARYAFRTKKLSLENFILINLQLQRLTKGFCSRVHNKDKNQGQAVMHYEYFLTLAMGLNQ